MSSFEPEESNRALLRHHLEQARSAATRLPDFEGAATVRKINELLGEPRPIRVIAGPFLRARRTWGSDHCFAAADGLPDDGPEAA